MVALPPARTGFAMYSARKAAESGLRHIAEQVSAIESAVVEQPALAFDLAKTIVESACRTILTEREIPHAANDDLPALFKTVTSNLSVLPVTASSQTEARRSLVQTLNGLHTALQGICELRNAFGFASHGSDGRRERLEADQAMLAAQAADAIVGFLNRVHVQDRALLPEARLQYDQQLGFNEFVDGANEISRVFSYEYKASEVLFHVDADAYRILLNEFSEEEPDHADGADADETVE